MDDGAGFASVEMEDEFIVYRMVFCCPFCTYVSPSEENVHSHAVSQHALQPTFRCPLCQEKLTGTANLRGHLGHGHNVVSECVEKLLQVAQKVEISFRTRILPLRVREELEQPVSETQSSREATHLGTEASPPESPCDEDPVGASDPVGDPEKQSGDTSCPLCRHTSESPQDLRTHFEKDHPELSPSDIQQACEGRSHETEGGEAGDRKCSQEITPVHSQQAIFRKTTNFAMDKFLDPSRPHKCVVCKESFTQKNILLVHYNSVSHLHKVRKASLDPSLSTRQEAGTGSSGHGVQTGQDKPYKCTVCNVSYNQSSTLEIHMRSVLHQTRSRGTKQDLTRVPTEKTQRDSGCKNETTNDLKGEPTGDLQGVEVAKKRHPQIGPCLGVPILPAAVASSSMQLSLDLPHPPPLVQPPQLFAPSLLSSFPLIPETLLKLQRQQQQLLLPFYLQELKVGGDGGTTPLLSFAQQPQQTKDNEGQQSVTLKPANEKDEKIPDEQEAATAETDLPQNSESKEDSPPKGPGDLTGSAARALLENFGFELVTQYNEGRQPSSCTSQPQPQPPAPPADVPPTPTSAEKLQCGTCGKLFSNRLILKTHEEHMHQRFLPFEALSRYAAHYRRSYDNHYPTGLTIETEESPLVPLDFSATSKCSQEMEEHDASCEWGVTVEQLSFLRSLLDLPSHATEEQILWAADKTGLSSAAVWQWYTQHEKGIQEGQEDDVEEPSRTDRLGNRRFSRTKFSDFQTQALNSFFESSAYPRDSEVEHLSTLLGLPGRVVVVWFQNARQKARKQAAETGNSPSSPLHSNQPGERPASNSKVPPCKKCGVNLPCIFQLIRHLKGCYSDQSNDITKEEDKEETGKTTQGEGSLPDKTTSQEHPTANTQEKKEEEQAEVKEKGETGTGDSKASAELPTISEEKVQILEKNNRPRPLDHNESSALLTSSEQNQNKPASNSSNLASPLVDLSLLISLGSGDGSCQRKRKHEEESLSPTGSEGGDEPPRDKRLRTTILPEQLDILHRWYLQDSNPTRSTLERISLEVGLKKRVVQVWFQNTRARERKGQYRGVASSTVSATRQQDEADGTKREVPPSYYYSVGPGQGAANVPAKTGQTISPMLAKTQASSGPTVNAVPSKSLINTTQAISGLLNAAKVLPSLANSSQSIPGLGNSNQALTSLVSTPQALSGLVNPAQVLSGLVNTTQATPNLLLATFTAKPTAPPILLTAATDVKPSPPPGQLVSLSVEKVVDPDKASASAALTKTPASEPQSCHQATEHQSLENQGGSTQKIPEDKGTPKTIDAQMHSPQTGDISDDSYSDPGPPSPGKSGFSLEGPMGSSGARRYRTQMSSLQLRILKACYSEYRTPSMQECECLGGEIGLQKRVVQVWFQNARAKEKKARLQGLGGTASTTEGPQPTECTHCNIKYGPTTPCRAHIFSRQHIARLRMSIQQQLKEESRYRDTHPAGGSAPPASENKQPSQILSFQAPNTVTTPIQRLTPLLMPGQGIPAPIGGLATFNAGPPPSLLGMASSVTPALLPRTAPTAPSSSHSSNDASMDSAQPAVTSDTSGPSPLKAAPLMGTPFMPFPLAPTATPLFTPQIQGPYFQQLYGLKKRLFPINPVIPHTLLGLLPAPVKPMAEAAPTRKMECTQTKATNECDVGLGEIQMGKEDSMEREDGPDDEDIPMVDVAMRYQCQRCKATYDEEGEAEAHQCESCYTGPPPHPPPLRLRVCTYHCLSCQVLLQGPTARSQHLRSQQHRAQSMCGDGASTAIPQLRPKSTATSVLMAL